MRRDVLSVKKIELHAHFDGMLNVEHASKLLGYPADAAMSGAGSATLAEFLSKFKLPLQLLQTKENLTEFARLAAEDLAADDVIYAEIRFCPLLHQEKGLTSDEVVKAVLDGLHQVRTVETNLILCMMRHLSLDQNKEIIDLAGRFWQRGVVAVDLAGDEAARPNTDPEFEKLFRYARSRHVPYTIHAGEAADYRSVEAAIWLEAKRIGHGVLAFESPRTVEQLIARRMPLEICVSSNIVTGVYPSIKAHPIRQLLAAGAIVTINTDDSTVVGTRLSREYELLKMNFGFTDEDLLHCNLNAALASFASNWSKVQLCQELLADYSRNVRWPPQQGV